MFWVQYRRWLVPLVVGALVILVDQVTKVWIVQNLGPVQMLESITIVDDWFLLVYSHNTGVAFSLFQGMSPVLTVVALLIVTGALYAYVSYLPNYLGSVQVSMGLIIGGAFGNIIDRVRLGYVVDFIQVGWWPIFNVADSAITVGAVMLGFFLLFYDEPDAEPEPRDDALLSDLLHRDVPATSDPASPASSAEGAQRAVSD